MKFFLLDKQQNIIGRLSEEYILEATFTEEINTAGELLITLPAKKRLSGNVIHVLITNPSKDHSYLMFKIIKETVKDEEVEYTAVESAYDELTSYGYIQDKRPTANAQTITEMILKDTRWHVGEIPDTSEAFISFYYLSVLDCLKKIVQTFDFEIGFDVLINDDENQITDRRVNFYIKQGEQTGKRFEYGSNLLSVKQEQDTQNIYTALVGRGKGVEISDGNDNTHDGYGRRITFSDVEWSKENGDPLDKPKGQEWIEDPDATKHLGFSDGHMRIGLEVFEDIDDPKILLQKTYEALKTSERPKVQFSASVINTGDLHLGDRVGITRNDIGITYETRVFKVQHNLLDETQNQVDLGDNLEQTNSLSYQVSALQSEITNHQETLITVTQSANGKNKVFYSPTTPATGSNGDVWYKDLGNGETEMYLYDNGWQLIISTENLHKIENEVKQQQKMLNQAIQDANAASAKADGLVAQVGDANTNAQKALTTAQQNQSGLSQAKLDLQNTEQGLQGVEADLSSVKSQAVQQGKTIIDIQKKNDSLSSQIADAQGNIMGLKQTAQGLQASVQDNKNNIANIKQTAGSIQSTVASMQNAGENLIVNSNFEQGAYHWNLNGWQISNDDEFRNHKTISKTQSGLSSANYNAFSATDLIPVQKGQTISIGVWVKASSVDSSGDGNWGATFGVNWYADNHSGRNHWTDFNDRTYYGNHDWQFLKMEGLQPPADSNFARAHFFITQNGTAEFALPIMVYGDKLPAWGPSPLDSATATNMSTIEQTVNVLKSTVQNNKGDISQLNQNANSLTAQIGNAKDDISSLKQRAGSIETNISNNKRDISSLKQTANSLQSNIQSKASVSQVTQLSDVFQTTVQTIGPVLLNGTFDDKNVAAYYIPWDITKNMNNISINSNAHWLDLFGINNDDVKYMYKYYMPVIPGTVLTYSGSSKLNWGGGTPEPSARFYIHFYNTNKDEIQAFGEFYYRYDRNNQWQGFSVSVTVPNGAAYVRIESRLTLNGCHQKTWLSLDDLKVSSGGDTISSKISQLSNDINLRVQKGDLISQINIEAGKTLIQSKNLYLDSDTVTFSGRAFIPSAAITDLSADKITAGTLNAGKVNVINLNVNKLVGDTTEFVRSGWTDAYGYHVQIEGEGMRINYGDWKTTFNSIGMKFNMGNALLGGITSSKVEGTTASGIAMYAGGNASFLAFAAQDFTRSNQDPIPAKAIWMREEFKGTGNYKAGWNFLDDVWLDTVSIKSIEYNGYTIHFNRGPDGALALIDNNGAGVFWSSDGYDAGFVINNIKYGMKGKTLITEMNSDGTANKWITL